MTTLLNELFILTIFIKAIEEVISEMIELLFQSTLIHVYMIECESMNKSSKSVIMTGGLKRTTNEKTLTLDANLNRAIMLFFDEMLYNALSKELVKLFIRNN